MSSDPANTPRPHDPVRSPDEGQLEALLREWHVQNAERARAGRDRLAAALAAERSARSAAGSRPPRSPRGPRPMLRRLVLSRSSPLAAAALLALVAGVLLLVPRATPSARADANIVWCPEGGRLEALTPRGEPLGPCVLEHTAVEADIVGDLARVTLRQSYRNEHARKIEAVYTFPLGHRGEVDRMTMTIGDRVLTAQIKERDPARQLYRTARDAGRVAGLLEQQRPNVFTQRVANIDPGARVIVEISYVEVLEPSEGRYEFAFPLVVGPRYVPGASRGSFQPAMEALPPGLERGSGLVLLAPPRHVTVTPAAAGAPPLGANRLAGLLAADAEPVRRTGLPHESGPVTHTFAIEYPDGSSENGVLHADGTGAVGGRWFLCQQLRDRQPLTEAPPGGSAAEPTDRVPDAAEILPAPSRPLTRAGHDVSIAVRVQSGGPGLLDLRSESHELRHEDEAAARRTPAEARLTLAQKKAIPNRDFVLSWRLNAAGITESMLAHTGPRGNFFCLTLRPPARLPVEQAVARELVFVLDTSASMEGFPIAKSRAITERVLAGMRPRDTFNLITFAGHAATLWDRPRPATPENVDLARRFVSRLESSGGTEMLRAIHAALDPVAHPPLAGAAERSSSPGAGPPESPPLRLAIFLTDGYVGDDLAIVEAVARHRGTTRVFAVGIGNSVNRWLIEAMARAGGGAADYALIESEADAVAERLARRISTPVLAGITVRFEGDLRVVDALANGRPLDEGPHDLFDDRPLRVLGRYTAPGKGTIIISGRTARGGYAHHIPLTLPGHEPGNEVIGTIWAREKIAALLARGLGGPQLGRPDESVRREIVGLGEAFGIVTPFTSMVAVDRLRVTLAGKPVLVNVPVEIPDAMSAHGVFGPGYPPVGAQQAPNGELPLGPDDGLGVSPPEMNLMDWPAHHPPPAGADATGGAEAIDLPEAANVLRLTRREAPGGTGARSRERGSGQDTALPGEDEQARGRQEAPHAAARSLDADRAAGETASPEPTAASSPAAAPFPSAPRPPEAQVAEAVTNCQPALEGAQALRARGQVVPATLLVAGCAVYAAERAEAGETVAAAKAAELGAALETYEPLLELRELLRQAPPPADAPAQLAAIRAGAQADLDRASLLLRRLDPALLELLRPSARARADTGDHAPGSGPGRATGAAARPGAAPTAGPALAAPSRAADPPDLLVSVLVDRPDASRLRDLRSAGLRVEHVSAAERVVVGRVAAAQLEALALLDGVRRVVPADPR